MSRHAVRVLGVPEWVPAARLLGAAEGGDWVRDADGALSGTLDTAAAADLSARLRGLGLGGVALAVECRPTLPRAAVRAARLEDARRRRDTTPGFLRPGARLDAEGRISLTPEALALELAHAALADAGPAEVWDLGCGAGGNVVAFARAGARVTAVERDAARLQDARHNADLYGVSERVRFVEGDAVSWLSAQPVEAGTLLFVDPPWGAEWDRLRCVAADFPLLVAVAALRGPRRVLAKVPSSFDPRSLGGDARATPYFGVAAGDAQRVKFLTVVLPPA